MSAKEWADYRPITDLYKEFRSSDCIIQHLRLTHTGWRDAWRGEWLRGVVDKSPVTTRAAQPSPRQ